MADHVDLGQERELADREKAIAAARAPRVQLMAVGECHYCAETVAMNKLFCGAECAQEWERTKWHDQQRPS